MQQHPDSLVKDLQAALECADDTEVKFHIRQALQHVETGRIQQESAKSE